MGYIRGMGVPQVTANLKNLRPKMAVGMNAVIIYMQGLMTPPGASIHLTPEIDPSLVWVGGLGGTSNGTAVNLLLEL